MCQRTGWVSIEMWWMIKTVFHLLWGSEWHNDNLVLAGCGRGALADYCSDSVWINAVFHSAFVPRVLSLTLWEWEQLRLVKICKIVTINHGFILIMDLMELCLPELGMLDTDHGWYVLSVLEQQSSSGEHRHLATPFTQLNKRHKRGMWGRGRCRAGESVSRQKMSPTDNSQVCWWPVDGVDTDHGDTSASLVTARQPGDNQWRHWTLLEHHADPWPL